jgi:hypothetical protein
MRALLIDAGLSTLARVKDPPLSLSLREAAVAENLEVETCSAFSTSSSTAISLASELKSPSPTMEAKLGRKVSENLII